MASLLSDLRYGVRSLQSAPLFTTVAAISIALAIGANTAVFTLLDQVLLRSLPVQAPTEVVQVSLTDGFFGATLGDGSELSYAMYTDLRDRNQVFDGMFCRMPTNMHVGFRGRAERVSGELVSGPYFRVLGVRAALDSTLT